MSPSLVKLLFLVALLIIWTLFGKRMIALLLVRRAGQGALNRVGKKAIDAQPFVNFTRDEFPQVHQLRGHGRVQEPAARLRF